MTRNAPLTGFPEQGANAMSSAAAPRTAGDRLGGELWRPKVSLELDMRRFEAYVDGRAIDLTKLEFDILAYLASHAPAVVSHEELVSCVARGVYSPGDSSVRVHISHLRRKLGPAGAIIHTVRGRGFRVEL